MQVCLFFKEIRANMIRITTYKHLTLLCDIAARNWSAIHNECTHLATPGDVNVSERLSIKFEAFKRVSCSHETTTNMAAEGG